ncbi:hypothetical protein Btru_070765 [Bulinus truncatus]|nr:hypothetical protein Btru_070765 [Bulinus truncatus]
MTNNDHWFSSQGIKARLSTYIGAAWTRLLKDSVDSRRMFQLMFELKFGQCASMISDEEGEESETVKHDVLVVHDDKGKEPNHKTILARNLALVCNVIFGLDTYIHLEVDGNCGIQYEESLLKEMERHCLVLFIVGENDSKRHASCPSFLERKKCLIFSDSPWQQSKLMDTTVGQQTAMISDQQTVIISDQQTVTSSDQQREKISIKQTDISSDQQTDISSDQQMEQISIKQTDISSDQQTVTSSDQQREKISIKQTDFSSDQQTLTSNDQQRETISIKQTDISSDQQTLTSNDQQREKISIKQTDISSDQQTLTSSDQQREKISIKQTDISSAQYNEITIVKPNEISIIQQTETRGTNQNDISSIQNSEINSRLGMQASVSDQNSAVTPGTVNSNQQCDINLTQHNDIDCTYLTKAQAMSNKYVIEKFFDGNKEILMELFCFLIDESFDLHRECFPFMLQM